MKASSVICSIIALGGIFCIGAEPLGTQATAGEEQPSKNSSAEKKTPKETHVLFKYLKLKTEFEKKLNFPITKEPPESFANKVLAAFEAEGKVIAYMKSQDLSSCNGDFVKIFNLLHKEHERHREISLDVAEKVKGVDREAFVAAADRESISRAILALYDALLISYSIPAPQKQKGDPAVSMNAILKEMDSKLPVVKKYDDPFELLGAMDKIGESFRVAALDFLKMKDFMYCPPDFAELAVGYVRTLADFAEHAKALPPELPRNKEEVVLFLLSAAADPAKANGYVENMKRYLARCEQISAAKDSAKERLETFVKNFSPSAAGTEAKKAQYTAEQKKFVCAFWKEFEKIMANLDNAKPEEREALDRRVQEKECPEDFRKEWLLFSANLQVCMDYCRTNPGAKDMPDKIQNAMIEAMKSANTLRIIHEKCNEGESK